MITEIKNWWVTSDSHYNHKNIVRGITRWRLQDGSLPIGRVRDFESLEEMNSVMVNNINMVVKQEDGIIHVGDWSFGGFESIEIFWNRLVCKNIILIPGNHDKHIRTNLDEIKRIFIKVQNEYSVRLYDREFLFHHIPLASWNGIDEGVIHLHGHVHSTGDNRFGVGKRMDVGIDGHPEFRPYNLQTEIIPLMDMRETVTSKHHGRVIEENLDDRHKPKNLENSKRRKIY